MTAAHCLAQAVQMAREESVRKAGEHRARYVACCAAVRYRIVPFAHTPSPLK